MMCELHKYMFVNDSTKTSVILILAIALINMDNVWPVVIELLLDDIYYYHKQYAEIFFLYTRMT